MHQIDESVDIFKIIRFTFYLGTELFSVHFTSSKTTEEYSGAFSGVDNIFIAFLMGRKIRFTAETGYLPKLLTIALNHWPDGFHEI